MKRKLKLIFAIVSLVLIVAGVVVALRYFTKVDRRAKVVVTTFAIYDICVEIMGSDDDLLMLMDNGVDMHSYSPTASDIASISQAELFICVGGESESWVGDVLATARNVNLKSLSLMNIDGITLLEENNDNIIQGGHDHEHEHEESHDEQENAHIDEHEYDEHVWLSIKNVIRMVDEIRNSLTNVYPEMQQLFKKNADEYIDKLTELDMEYENSIKSSKKTLIVADRFPFRYLVEDYDINYYAVFSGCSAETEASTETIAHLVEKINAENVDYLIVLESSDRKVASSCISNGNCKDGLQILTLDSCQSIRESEIGRKSYFQIMTHNLEVLKKALV